MDTFGICRFCNITCGEYHYKGIDEPFASNEEFIAIASIGALVKGWTLIIPKTHQFSLRNNYNRPLFNDILHTVIPLLVKRYGTLISFEHGANREGSITSCGTDHAHLHIVPFGESLLPDLKNYSLQWLRCRANEIASICEGSEYLFYCDLDEKKIWKNTVGYLHILNKPISQFFRVIIARRKGVVDMADYKQFPQLDSARETRRTLIGSVV